MSGSKSSKLARAVDTNEVNIYENGLLDAFKTVQAGRRSPLIDQIFCSARPEAPAAARTLSAPTAPHRLFRQQQPGRLRELSSAPPTRSGGVAGNLLKTANLPLELHRGQSAVPAHVLDRQLRQRDLQFAAGRSQQALLARLQHAVQLCVVAQPRRHLAATPAAEPWEEFRTAYRTLRNRHLDKGPLSFDYQSVFKINGTLGTALRPRQVGRQKCAGLAGPHHRRSWQVGAVGCSIPAGRSFSPRRTLSTRWPIRGSSADFYGATGRRWSG